MSYKYIIFALGFAVTACDSGPNTGRGFSLPEGDVERGKQTFLTLGCHACHTVGDIEMLALDGEAQVPVKLGGEVGSIKTYGDLVTSVINPSHKISPRYRSEQFQTEDGDSIMVNYNNVMTVSQLVDLVTFLESNYTLVTYQRTKYRYYGP